MTNKIYESVTNKIIEKIESGNIGQWFKSWSGDIDDPKNPVTGTQYRGINYLLLKLSPFTNPNWLTFKQISEKGGRVLKGEKSTMVIYYKKFNLVDEEGEATGKTIPLLKSYLVFNAEQTEGLSKEYFATPEPKEKQFSNLLDVAQNSGFKIKLSGSQAFYSPASDQITMPAVEQFNDVKNFEATLLHELTHLTGHESRLNRINKFNKFGSAAYAFEELIAELGSAFACAKLKIEGEMQHAEYLNSWLQVLRKDSKAIFKAATEAQKACDWLIDNLKTPAQSLLLAA